MPKNFDQPNFTIFVACLVGDLACSIKMKQCNQCNFTKKSFHSFPTKQNYREKVWVNEHRLNLLVNVYKKVVLVVSIDLFFFSNCLFSCNGVYLVVFKLSISDVIYALDLKEQSVRDNNHTLSAWEMLWYAPLYEKGTNQNQNKPMETTVFYAKE